MGQWATPPTWLPAGSQRPALPPISKATVFVVVSKSVPEAEGDTDIIYHISGAFQHLQRTGREGWEPRATVLGAPTCQPGV